MKISRKLKRSLVAVAITLGLSSVALVGVGVLLQSDAMEEFWARNAHRSDFGGRFFLIQGQIYASTKDQEQALENFDRAVKLLSQYQYTGIGIAFERKENEWAIVQVLEKGDAARQGLKMGDRILEVDDRAASSESKKTLIEWIRGKEGTRVKLRLARVGTEEFEATLTRSPIPHYQLAEAYAYRGTTSFALKHYSAALSDYDRALELNSQFYHAYHNRGLIWKRLKNYPAAIADLSAAIELQPDNGKIYRDRGATYADLQDYDRAIADFSTAIKLQPDDSKAYQKRCSARIKLKAYTAAITDCDRALKLDPNNGYAYYHRGAARHATGQIEAALQDWHTAAELHQKQGKTKAYQYVFKQIERQQTN